MKIYRCRICGEAYVGPEKPGTCPYCGAHKDYLIFGKDWIDENQNITLEETDKLYLLKALALEINAARFYKCASNNSDDPETAAMFKSFSKVEAEHADAIFKILRQEATNEAKKVGECNDEILPNLKEAAKREEHAIDFYKEIVKNTTEERIETVFKSLIEIETDHLKLSKMEIERIG